MKLPRRHFLHLTAGAAVVPIATRAASALDYPTRPVHLLVGFPAGSGPDIRRRRRDNVAKKKSPAPRA